MPEIKAPYMNKAIAEFVLRKAAEMKRDPVDMIWLGYLIAQFMYSNEAKAANIIVGGGPHEHATN